MKIAVVNRNSQEEHLRNNLSRDINVHRMSEDYITQVSEKTESRVFHKYCQELGRIEGRFLGAVETGRVSSELTSSGASRNPSGDFPQL